MLNSAETHRNFEQIWPQLDRISCNFTATCAKIGCDFTATFCLLGSCDIATFQQKIPQLYCALVYPQSGTLYLGTFYQGTFYPVILQPETLYQGTLCPWIFNQGTFYPVIFYPGTFNPGHGNSIQLQFVFCVFRR